MFRVGLNLYYIVNLSLKVSNNLLVLGLYIHYNSNNQKTKFVIKSGVRIRCLTAVSRTVKTASLTYRQRERNSGSEGVKGNVPRKTCPKVGKVLP